MYLYAFRKFNFFSSYILLSILTKNGRAAVRNLELSAIKPEFTISILSLSGYFV